MGPEACEANPNLTLRLTPRLMLTLTLTLTLTLVSILPARLTKMNITGVVHVLVSSHELAPSLGRFSQHLNPFGVCERR